MIGIRIGNTFLDLYGNTSISFELNTPVFLGEDVDILPGSFSFPVNLPASRRNVRLLKYPAVEENEDRFIVDEDCEVFVDGNVLFVGLLSVRSASAKSIRIYIIINELKKLKDLNLNECNLETLSWSSVANAQSEAKDTATNPQNYNHIFFQLYNPGFFGNQGISEEEEDFQNRYSLANQQFITGSGPMAITPFVKVDYLLERMFNVIGLTISNEFQTSEELRRLCAYNNYSIHDGSNWGLEADLNNHVNPDTEAADYLKNLCRHFGLAPFVNSFEKSARLIALKDLLGQPPRHDWTRKFEYEYNVEELENIATTWTYGKDVTQTAVFDDVWKDSRDRSTIANVVLESDIDINDPSGWYYILSTDQAIKHEQGVGRVFGTHSIIPTFEVGEDGETYTSPFKPILDWNNFFEAIAVQQQFRSPSVRVAGASGEDTARYEDRLVFYRDFALSEEDDLYPFASVGRYNYKQGLAQVNGQSAQYSLHWDKPGGLFPVWWSSWYESLRRRRKVSCRLLLSVQDILNFEFQDKVRIKSSVYFVKSLKVTINNRGIQPVEAELVTTL